MVKDGNPWISKDSFGQGTRQDMARGAATSVENAAAGVAGFQAQVRFEHGSPIENGPRRLSGEDSDCLSVVEAGSNGQCVRGVQRRRVIGADGRGDATLRAWAGASQNLACRENRDAGAELTRPQSGGQPRGAGTHYYEGAVRHAPCPCGPSPSAARACACR